MANTGGGVDGNSNKSAMEVHSQQKRNQNPVEEEEGKKLLRREEEGKMTGKC